MAFRTVIPDFQLANPMYVGASVLFYTVDEDGEQTETLATLYAAPTGSITTANPQTLDSEGKFAAPVYIDVPVVANVSGATVGTHVTGVISARGTWRGNWVTGTTYFVNDFVRDGSLPSEQQSVYVVSNDFVSGATLAADVSAGDLVLVLDPTAAYGSALVATSASSLSISTGAKVFTIEENKQFAAGQFVLAVDAGNPDNFMIGQVSSYTGATLTIDAQATGGSGTVADWDISVSGAQGAKGDPGTIPWAIADGTADAITATFVPALPALSDGMLVGVRFAAANTTTTPTFNPDGTGALTMVRDGGAALVAGDTGGANYESLLRYNLANTRWEMLSPAITRLSMINPAALTGNVFNNSGVLATRHIPAARSDNWSFAADDRAKPQIVTAASKTGTLLAAATAGPGWFSYVESRAAGTVIASPATNIFVNDAAAVASYTMASGETAFIWCNGASYFIATTNQPATASVQGGVKLLIASEIDTGTDASKAATAAAVAGSKRTVKAWWRVEANGTLANSFGISSSVRNSAGNYTVNLSATAPVTTYAGVVTSDNLITSLVSQTASAFTWRTGAGGTYNAIDANSNGQITY